MTYANVDLINALVFLLPGVIAATVFYSITAYKKPNAFRQIFHALTFTAIGQLIAALIQTAFANPGYIWTPALIFALPTASAVLAAVIIAFLSNHDLTHKPLRLLGVTRETAYPAWHSAFINNPDCAVALHLKDQRRLFGWPEYWPSQPRKGHFKLINAQWLANAPPTADNSENHIIHAILIDVNDIAFIEFIKAEEISPNEKGDANA